MEHRNRSRTAAYLIERRRRGRRSILGGVLAALLIAALSASASSAHAYTAYVANFLDDNVTPVDTATNTAGTPIAVGTNPTGIAITPDGATAYVANQGSDNVTPIDTATNTAGTPITVGTNPLGIAITPDGATAYVANEGSDNVIPIDTQTNTAGTPIAVGAFPRGIAIGPDPVAPASPTLSTSASAAVTLGGQVHDTATLAGGSAPTGTITFKLYGPGDPTCSNAPVFTDIVNVAGNGDYQSPDFTPAEAGTYRWTADYSGDANNDPASSPCNAPNESVTVAKAATTTALASSPNPSSLGQAVTFTATVSGAGPTGTVDFRDGGATITGCGSQALAGGVATCTTSALSTGAHSISADYGGDANNDPSTSPALTQTVNPPAFQPVNPPVSQPAPAPSGEDPKCAKLRKKLKRQKHGLGRAHGERKRSTIRDNIKDTKKRLRKLAC
jgi:YVTN family beta-propeller protein